MLQYVVYVFPVVTLTLLLLFFFHYYRTLRASVDPLAWITSQTAPERPRFTFAGKIHPMERKDALPILLITGIYAVTAFWSLGATTSPQSFASFSQNETVAYEMEQTVYLTSFRYYTGLGTGAYQFEISEDGENWLTLWQRKDADGKVTGCYWADGTGFAPSYAMTQEYNQLLKWIEITPENPQNARYLRITGKADRGLLELGELALYRDETRMAPPDTVVAVRPAQQIGAADWALFDEQDIVPDQISWFNSAYFDEIYHPRTAFEHTRGIYPYEISHPPLGKLTMALGIELFGMTPFGWRFMGTLLGVGMVPLLYLFLKNLFGKRIVASCGAILLSCDFMHLTQTRIGTIDTYGVFYILLMYYFLYRYLTLPAGTPFRKCALPLFLSGLFWGMGAASKWTVVYGCVGLAILYFVGLYQKLRDWPVEEGAEVNKAERTAWCLKILLFSVLCFAVVPVIIYTLSYLPYAYAKGDMSLSGLLSAMWENQKYMLTYHKGVKDTHPYSSRWYQWILNLRPILYYLGYPADGMKSAFGAFLNPVVCWGGLLAIIASAVQVFRRRCAKALFLVVGYLSQLLPWLLIRRITFEYHYFPSVIFLILALCYVFNDLLNYQARRAKWAIYGVTGGAAVLYAAFYPVLTGIAVPAGYTMYYLKWFPSWPF